MELEAEGALPFIHKAGQFSPTVLTLAQTLPFPHLSGEGHGLGVPEDWGCRSGDHGELLVHQRVRWLEKAQSVHDVTLSLA